MAINVEYFFDHSRLEQMCFEGGLVPVEGMLCGVSVRLGLRLECKLPAMKSTKSMATVVDEARIA
jgi:hypothetical protein